MYLLFIYIFFTSFSLNLAAPEGPETPSKKKKKPWPKQYERIIL